MTAQALPGAQIRPIPGSGLGKPRNARYPQPGTLTRLGMTTADLGLTVDAMVDGPKPARTVFMVMKSIWWSKTKEGKLERTQDLPNFRSSLHTGEKVTLDSLAEIKLGRRTDPDQSHRFPAGHYDQVIPAKGDGP